MSEPSESQARRLVDTILRLSREHDFRSLLELALDPTTYAALDLLPERTTSTARVQLQGALKWRDQQYRRNAERMDEVRAALDAYDLTLARGLLRRVEPRLVAEADRARFDELLLETEARAIESEQLSKVAAEIAPPPSDKKRRWFRRR